MALSCRAKAFSIDSLLRKSPYRPADDLVAEATFSQSNTSTIVLVGPRDSARPHVSSQQYVLNISGLRNQESADLTVPNNSFPAVNITSDKHGGSGSSDCEVTVNKKEDFNEKNKVASREGTLPVDHQDRAYFSEESLDHSGQDPDFYNRPLGTRTISRAGSEENSPSSKTYNSTSVPDLPVPSCFCHGDVTFCHHPGIKSVTDARGSGSSVVAKLCHADLWASFHGLGTEMIITKSGRRMFPALKLRLSGLNPDKLYTVRLEFLQPDTRKYRYIYHSSRWMVSGSGDTMPTPHGHMTTEGPINGEAICSQIVSFERIKLTNTEPCKTGQMSLVSMQKFQPQVIVEEVSAEEDGYTSSPEKYVIVFPQTSFMAVTAYQNHQITTLKIASNPFAKGFRESGKTRIPYECLIPTVPNLLSCKTALDYLPGVIASQSWSAFCQHESFNGKRRNDHQSHVDLCTPIKMRRRDIHKVETTGSQTDLVIKACPADQSLLYSTLHRSYTLPHLYQNHLSYPRQHLLEIQDQQQVVAASNTLPTWLSHHHSGLHAPPAFNPTCGPLSKVLRPHSSAILEQPAPAHAPHQVKPGQPLNPDSDLSEATNALSTSPEPLVLPPTMAASPTVSDPQSSIGAEDLRQCQGLHQSEPGLQKQASLQSLSLLPSFKDAAARSQSSDSSPSASLEFPRLRCVTEPVKISTDEPCHCTGCDYHAMRSGYESLVHL